MNEVGEPMFDLLVVGELNPDAIVLAESIEPEFGQVEVLVEDGALTVGSSGAIVACGAARLGMRTAYAGVVGDDAAGRFMLGELSGRSIDVTGCRTDPDLATGLSVVLSTGGDRAILTFPGAMAALTSDDVSDVMLARTRHLHVASPGLQASLLPTLANLFTRAHVAGASTSLDPGWDPSERWGRDLESALAETDVFLPNATEACRFAGAEDPEEALDSLAERVGTVVVKLGPAGAIGRRGGERVEVAAPSMRSIDATGAGDSFAAGVLRAFGEGGALADALRLGVSCGALSTRGLGGVVTQPSLAEARELAETIQPNQTRGVA